MTAGKKKNTCGSGRGEGRKGTTTRGIQHSHRVGAMLARVRTVPPQLISHWPGAQNGGLEDQKHRLDLLVHRRIVCQSCNAATHSEHAKGDTHLLPVGGEPPLGQLVLELGHRHSLRLLRSERHLCSQLGDGRRGERERAKSGNARVRST